MHNPRIPCQFRDNVIIYVGLYRSLGFILYCCFTTIRPSKEIQRVGLLWVRSSFFNVFNVRSLFLPYINDIFRPLLTGDYAPVGYRCWITLEHNSARGEALRFLLLYVPLWAIVCFNSVSYYKVKKFLDQYMASGPERSFVRRLRAYPLILGLCWFGATVHSIYILFHCEKRYNFFDALSVGMSGLTGYFNAIAYGMNHHVQSALVRKFPFLLRFAQSCKGISCCYWASEHEKEFHETLDDLENLDTTKSCQGVELSILSNHRHLLSEVRTEGR